MTTEAKPPRRTRVAALSEEFGAKLVELATGHGLSVADYCDRELDAVVTEKYLAMLAAKMQAAAKGE